MAKRIRRIMRSFTIGEISAVDVPAAKHALATLIKRDMRPVEPKQFPDRVDPAARDAMLGRVLAAIEKREARERQEAQQMPDKDTDDHDIRKRSDDARASMDDAIAKRAPGISRYTAMEAWRRSHPREFAAMQAAPPAAPAPIAKRGEHTDFFERLTDQIRKRDGCDRVTAMERARAEDPGAYRRLQAGA